MTGHIAQPDQDMIKNIDQEYETPLWTLRKSEKSCFGNNYLHFHFQNFIEIVYYDT